MAWHGRCFVFVGLHFDENYSETVELLDGRSARLRLVRPTDKSLLLEGFAHLSKESRYRRFLGAKSALSETELRYLTELDGINHFAIAATCQKPDGVEEGVGVARFVRIPGQPNVAEAAVTVADAWQKQGLGMILLERLAEAAMERGISSFQATVLASNSPVRTLLNELGSAVSTERAAEEIVVQVCLPPVAREAGAHSEEEPLRRLLGTVARSTAERAAPGGERAP